MFYLVKFSSLAPYGGVQQKKAVYFFCRCTDFSTNAVSSSTIPLIYYLYTTHMPLIYYPVLLYHLYTSFIHTG